MYHLTPRKPRLESLRILNRVLDCLPVLMAFRVQKEIPSMSYLAALYTCDPRTIRRMFHKLSSIGLIERIPESTIWRLAKNMPESASDIWDLVK